MKKMNVGGAPLSDLQKGITLIALIITIIVMLILVGVTINVALNGGLIEKAKTAGVQTQREGDKEYLLSLIIDTVNNKGDFQITATSLTKDDWVAEQSENEGFIKCTSPKNEVFYVNIETGAILDTLPETEPVEEPVTETNVWKQRGLTSTNVQYGVTYKGTDQENAPGGMSYFVLDSNGTIVFENSMTDENLETMGYTIETGTNYIGFISDEGAIVIIFNSNNGAIYNEVGDTFTDLNTLINSMSEEEQYYNYTVSQ